MAQLSTRSTKRGLLLLWLSMTAAACKSPPTESAAASVPSSSSAAPQPDALFVRVVFGGWPRPMRYFAQPHVYAETKGARVTLEAGADYDEACTYAIETVELDAIPRTVRKLSERSKTATHVVVHVPNSFDAATLERVLRATESSGLTLSFAASYRPPERKSEPDCVPSTQIFDGPSLYDPFQESWAIFGACNARCAHESALEEDPCLKRCLRGSN